MDGDTGGSAKADGETQGWKGPPTGQRGLGTAPPPAYGQFLGQRTRPHSASSGALGRGGTHGTWPPSPADRPDEG